MHSEFPGAARNTFENVRHLVKTAGGPLTALAGLCREAGMELFPRVRMNSHYDIDPASPSYGRLRREHPELLIGRQGEQIPEGGIEWGIKTGLNYAFPEVREYMYSIITELFERFEVDGLELDFMRHPALFRTEEAFQSAYLMTGLVRRVRERMREVGSSRGRTIRLAVRVPPTLADSKRVGLDVAEWIADGLVDVVVVGGGFIPFETSVDEFAAAAEGTGIQVYGCAVRVPPTLADSKRVGLDVAEWIADGLVDIVVVGGGFIPFETSVDEFAAAAEGTGIQVYGCAVRVPPTLADSKRVGLDVAEWIADGLVDIVVVGGGFIPFETSVDEFAAAAEGTGIQVYGCIEALRPAVDERVIRALASLFWKSGASGVYLYNFFTMAGDWNRRVLNQIADPEALARLDKRYEIDQTGPFYPCGAGHSCAFRYASPPAQLPVTLGESYSGEGPLLRFEITDDLEAASADGCLAGCTLSLNLDNLARTHRIDARLNGSALPWSSGRVSHDGWSQWVRSGTAEHTITPSYPVEVMRPGVAVEYDLAPPPLKQGQNELEVHLVGDTEGAGAPVVLTGVDVSVNYRSHE